MSIRRRLSMSRVLMAAVLVAGAMGVAAPPTLAAPTPGPEVTPAVKHDVSPPLTSLANQQGQFVGQHQDYHAKPFHNAASSSQTGQAPSSGVAAPSAPAPGLGFDGVGNGVYGYTVNSAPPDTTGAVGRNHYFQLVNTAFAIFNKSGALVLGASPTNSIWSGFGGGCQANNDGDAVVQYDRLADRFIISQFSVTSPYPYSQCVAVSTTGDPTGTWFRYEFAGFGIQFPDYPKLSVWPDAYYITYNLFANGTTFSGPKFCAYDRARMLTGAAATQQCFTQGTAFGGDLAADLGGAAAPAAGTPETIIEFGSNALTYWKFHVDWTTPANTTLTGPTTLPVAAFSPACGGATCIPQAGTSQQLDSLADRLMQRADYRNFGDHESLVLTHAITAGSSVGARWYELRNISGSPTVYQQGTFAPDSAYRWMGSIAQDKAGDIGLEYSVSSSSLRPGIRYTGRVPTDPLGTMQVETNFFTGAGSQTGGLSRWGDYSNISVDPVDDCTFWFTNEYIPANGSFNWRTRIGTFKFSSCGTPDFSISATPASQSVAQGAGTSYSAMVTPSGGFTGTVTFSASGLPSGATASFNPASVAGSGSSTMTVTTATSTPAGSYPLTITGTSGSLVHSTSVTLVVTGPPDFSLSASPSSQSVAQGASTSYTINVTRTGGFTGAITLSVSGLPSGATGSFSPNPTTTASSTLTVTTAATTPTGSFALTITGVSGSLSHTTSATLVVNLPAAGDFSISGSPSSLTVKQGTSGSYTITITRTGGFSGAVTFSVSGAPAASNPTFNPNPASGNSATLTVGPGQTTPTGTFVLTVTGVSGSLTHTTTVTLVVTQGCFGGDGDC